MQQYSRIYKQELLNNIVPFWIKHGVDLENGGFVSCLDRYGKVYDEDKFVWLQGRAVWMFSTLYNTVEPNPKWLSLAVHGADFLEKHGRDVEGNWYFSLNKQGIPLTQPYSIFSDCYVAMGLGALYKASGREIYAEIAKKTFTNIVTRRHDPKGKYNKSFPGTRPFKNFSVSMILCNLSLELEYFLDASFITQLINELIQEIMHGFYNKEDGLIYENILNDGSFSDSFEGRLINPGHGLEAMWFLMDLGARINDKNLIDKAMKIAFSILEYGWDKEYGGIFYLLDSKNHSPQQLEWDQKLWWVHVEGLVCMAKAYAYTENEEAKKWFMKIHHYTWMHFKDNEYGEWFGYLNREGKILLNAKGGKWKGFFHIPRALLQVWKCLEDHSAKNHFVKIDIVD